MRSLWIGALCVSLAGCAADTPEQHYARQAALMRMGAIVASGGVAPAPTPAQPLLVPPPPMPMPAMAPPPAQNPFPPPQVRCTSSTDYMGQVHTICQ